MQSGDWYNADAVEHSISALTDALGNRGYAFVEVKPQITRNRDDPHHRRHLRRAGRAAGLCRAHRHHRQCAHARQGDPPRDSASSKATPSTPTRCSARRSASRTSASSRRSRSPTAPGSAPDKTVITVEVEEQSTGELSLGSASRPRDGPLADTTHPRAQLPRPRPGSAHRHGRFVPLAAGRSELYRAVFPRQEHRRRLRSVRDQDQPDRQFLLRRYPGLPAVLLWRLAARRLSDHREPAADAEIHGALGRHHRHPERCFAVHRAAGRDAPDLVDRPGSALRPARQPARSDRAAIIASLGNDFAGVGFGVAVRPQQGQRRLLLFGCAGLGAERDRRGRRYFRLGRAAGAACRIASLSAATICAASQPAGIGPRDSVYQRCAGRQQILRRLGDARRAAGPAEGTWASPAASSAISARCGANDQKNLVPDAGATGGYRRRPTADRRQSPRCASAPASACRGSPRSARSGSILALPIKQEVFDKTQLFRVSFGTRF